MYSPANFPLNPEISLKVLLIIYLTNEKMTLMEISTKVVLTIALVNTQMAMPKSPDTML